MKIPPSSFPPVIFPRTTSYAINMTSGNTVIGTRIKKLRDNAGLSQEMLATLTNVSQSFISAVERGQKLPSHMALIALARELNTNVDFLLGLTDDDRPLGNQDDQVVLTVEDPELRDQIQEAVEGLSRLPKEDRDYIMGFIKRLAPKRPRIIGGE